MPDIYARTAARGFPVFDSTGTQTGAGHLQDVTRLPEVAGLPQPGQPYPVGDPASTPAQLAPPEPYQLGPFLWGLPAGSNPDNTPHGVEYSNREGGESGPGNPSDSLRTAADDAYPQGPYHDAPLIDPGLATRTGFLRAEPDGLSNIEADAAHSDTDNSVDFLNPGFPDDRGTDSGWVGFQNTIRQDHVGPVEGGDPVIIQEKAAGSLRGNSGFDAVQGYGGGGKGPGGTNLPEITEDHRDYPGSFYSADGFTRVAEVPHLDAETAQFIQNQPGMAPWTGDMWSYPLTVTHAQDVTPADVPLQGQPVAASTGGLLTPMWGL